MSSLISIDDLIPGSGKFPVIDVRSESEFRQGHFPGAQNIPILIDEHRKEVGTTYKQEGREEAVIKGFDLAGPFFGDFIRKAKKIFFPPATDSRIPNTLLLYCWRGGMRSEIASWILTLAGFKIHCLNGGYKTFRHWVLETLKQEKSILVLGGMTGSGKTEILKHLSALGEAVIDLELLACHKGSAFGGLGQLPQPTNEHFENMLALEWAKIPGSSQNFVWMENESRTIGQNQIPDPIYELIRKSPVLEITVSKEKRLERILDEYGQFPVEQLIEKTKKLKKRLGGQHLIESLEYLEKNDYKNWAKKMLDYYDKAYSFGMKQRPSGSIFPVPLIENDYLVSAHHVKDKGISVMKKTRKNELSL